MNAEDVGPGWEQRTSHERRTVQPILRVEFPGPSPASVSARIDDVLKKVQKIIALCLPRLLRVDRVIIGAPYEEIPFGSCMRVRLSGVDNSVKSKMAVYVKKYDFPHN